MWVLQVESRANMRWGADQEGGMVFTGGSSTGPQLPKPGNEVRSQAARS